MTLETWITFIICILLTFLVNIICDLVRAYRKMSDSESLSTTSRVPSMPARRPETQRSQQRLSRSSGSRCPAINIERYGDGTDKVIFLPNATKKLLSIVDWGMKTPNNRYEQIYQGMGHIFVNDDHRVMIISHVLYIYAAERSPVSARIFNGTFDSIMERIEYDRYIYNQNEKSCNNAGKGKVYDPFIEYGSSEVVMYGHTHPGLGCFFSGPDRRSGFACEDLPAVTFVLDPIGKDMKAMTGVEERDAEIIVCSYKGSE